MDLPDTMMAAVMPRPNEVEIGKVPVPRLAPRDVMILVHACGICSTDLHILHGQAREARYPLIAGHELAGQVVAVGAQAEDVPVGAHVVAEGRAGTGFRRDGAYAEYVSVPKEMLHTVDSETDMIEAALIDPLACAVNAINQAELRTTDRAAVIGQGSSGLCILQAARAMVGCELVAIDHHDENLALSRRFGASLTINPKTVDALDTTMAWTQRRGLDCVLEATGRESAVNLALQIARSQGRIVIYGVFGQRVTLDLDTLMYEQIQMIGACGSHGTYAKAVELLSEGKVDLRSIVSRVMPLSQLPEAFQLLEERQVFKVVIVPDRLL